MEIQHIRITDVSTHEGWLELVAHNSAVLQARTIILATCLKESLPATAGIDDYYGKSLFCCPYCDGWELKDKPLVVIAEEGRPDRLCSAVIGLCHQWRTHVEALYKRALPFANAFIALFG